MSNESEKYQIIQLLNAELNLSRYLAEKIYFDSFRLFRYCEVEDNCEVTFKTKSKQHNRIKNERISLCGGGMGWVPYR